MDYRKALEEQKKYAAMVRSGEISLEDENISSDVGGILKRLNRDTRPEPRPISAQEKMAQYFMELENTKTMEAPPENPRNPLPEVSNSLHVAREAIAQIESSGNYQAIGPVLESGSYKGQRPIGRYQVMEGNIPEFTKEALGESYSTEEFIASPAAQDAVAEYFLAKNYKKYGSWEDAASVWFSGRPVAKAGNASDGYKTVPEYISNFRNAYRTLAANLLEKDNETPEEGIVRRRG